MSLCARIAIRERQISHARIIAELQSRNKRMSRYLARLESFSKKYNEGRWEDPTKQSFDMFRSTVFDDTGIDITIMDL